jgi:hypothetical protein
MTPSSLIVNPWHTIALESPTLIQNIEFSCITIPINVDPEKAISIPDRSS